MTLRVETEVELDLDEIAKDVLANIETAIENALPDGAKLSENKMRILKRFVLRRAKGQMDLVKEDWKMTTLVYVCTKANGEVVEVKTYAEAQAIKVEGGEYKVKYTEHPAR